MWFHKNAARVRCRSSSYKIQCLKIKILFSYSENIQIVFNIDYENEKGDDDKEYVVPKKLHFDFEVRDNANFQLTNLFNGNKELGKYLHNN